MVLCTAQIKAPQICDGGANKMEVVNTTEAGVDTKRHLTKL